MPRTLRPKKEWAWKPKICKVCSLEYIPASSNQRYCMSCRKDARRERQRAYGQLETTKENQRVLKRELYNEVRFKSVIPKDTFKCLVQDTIDRRKGDIMSVKSIGRFVLKKLGMWDDLPSHSPERETCYVMVRDMMSECGAHEFGWTYRSGIQMKFPKKERNVCYCGEENLDDCYCPHIKKERKK